MSAAGQGAYLRCSKRLLDQVAISAPGLRMFVREPQKHEPDNRHKYIDWENQSHVSRREVARNDHLVNVTASCAQREYRRRNQRSEAKRQARLERNDSGNSYTQTCESHFCLKRAVFPSDKLCGYVAKEHVKYEVDQIVYSDGEKQVVQNNASLTTLMTRGFGFFASEITAVSKPMMKQVRK